jgi:tetratricopeptide (TPR) repeat protein
MNQRTGPELILILVLLGGLSTAVFLSRWIDGRNTTKSKSEEQLYLDGPAARRLSLSFNGLAADWYWMRSLQYVGGKIVNYQDAHEGNFDLANLSTLDLRLLPSLLDVTTTLDPQFIAAYEYGAVILPEVRPEAAVALLEKGIATNPTSWRLYQHLGYIYWQRKDYDRASEAYAVGSKLPGAPGWVAAMAARMKADRGSRDAAREMYQHLAESSGDNAVKEMVAYQLMRLDWLDDRDLIRKLISDFREQTGRCPQSWRELADRFGGTRLRIDLNTGSPVDTSQLPYHLTNGGCDVDLDRQSKVPRA